MSRATFTYGRFNPPTEAGHGKLIKQVMDHAESTGGKHYIFASHSQDSEKNPLSHQYKTRAMRKMFPGANVVTKKHSNLLSILKHLEKQGHTHVTMFAGSDRIPEYKTIANKYNGKDFNFKKIEIKSAGSRDPDAEGAEGMSASKLRGLVSAGKRRQFISHYTNKKLGAEIHDKVKKAMSESRALFLLGGPGSGKDYVINNILNRFNVVEVQMDQILNGSANELLESEANLLINAPIDLEKIALVRATLGEAYEFDYALVSVTNKVSRERNDMRARPMNESVRIRKWLDAERTTDLFEGVFKFENSLNLAEATQKELTVFQMQIEAFLKFMIENGYVFEKKVAEPTGDLKKACWKGYTAVGMKMKNGRKVPNCVPVKESRFNPDGSPKGPSKATVRFGKKQDFQAALLQFKRGMANDDLSNFSNFRDDKKKGVTEGFDPEPSEIADYLKKKHGKVTKQHLDAYERARDTRKPLDRKEIMRHLKNKESKITPVTGMGGVPGFKVTNRRLKQTRSFNNEKDAQAYAARGGKQQKEALEYGTREARDAYLKATPGQQIDLTPTLTSKSPKKGKITPPSDLNARQGGGGGYIGGLTQTFPESVSLEEAVQYHLENRIPFAENIFRPGSDMFFELIREAKNLYADGEYTPADEYEQEVLESDLGEIGIYEGQEVMLDFPFLEEEKMPKHVRKLSKTEADEEEAVKVSIQKEANDYFRRRKREEDIISGKKPPRKKIPTRNDYAERRARMAEGLNESAYEEAWELISQPVPEIQQFVQQLGLSKDDATAKQIAPMIDAAPDTQISAASIPKLKNLANKGNDVQTLKAIQQISGRPDAAQQYVKLMQIRDAGEGRNRGYDVGGLIKSVQSGNYEAPVLLKLPTGVYVIGGRTRLYAALALGIPAKVKIISANNFKQGVAEEACCDDCDDLNEEEGSSDPTKGKGIGKPWKEGGGGAVYVRTGDGGVKKVRFSQSGMAKKYRDPGRLKSFMARHNCLGNKDKTSASYWACRYPRFFSNSGQLWW